MTRPAPRCTRGRLAGRFCGVTTEGCLFVGAGSGHLGTRKRHRSHNRPGTARTVDGGWATWRFRGRVFQNKPIRAPPARDGGRRGACWVQANSGRRTKQSVMSVGLLAGLGRPCSRAPSRRGAVGVGRGDPATPPGGGPSAKAARSSTPSIKTGAKRQPQGGVDCDRAATHGPVHRIGPPRHRRGSATPGVGRRHRCRRHHHTTRRSIGDGAAGHFRP